MPELTEDAYGRIIDRINTLLALLSAMAEVIEKHAGKIIIVGLGPDGTFKPRIDDPVEFIEKSIIHKTPDGNPPGKYMYSMKALIPTGQHSYLGRQLCKFNSKELL